MTQIRAAVDALVSLLTKLTPGLGAAVHATFATPAALVFAVLVVTSVSLAVWVLRRYTPSRMGIALALLVWPYIALSLLGGIAAAFLASVGLCTVSLLVGLAVEARLGMLALDALERSVLGFVLGFGIIGLATLALAVTGLLVLPVIVVVAVVLLAASIFVLRRRGYVVWPADPRLAPIELVMVWVCALLVEAVSVYVVAPEVDYDSTYYHLTLARDFATAGGAPSLPELWTSNIPILPQLLYAAATAASSIDSGKLLHFAAGLASALLIYAIAARLRGRKAGLLAVILWLTPLVLWEMASAYADLFLALWALAGMLAAMVWAETRQRSYAIVAGACMGFGFGVKIGMFYVALPLAIALFVFYIRSRRDLATWLWGGAVGIALAAPWYVRSYVLTGNPIFPLYNAVFRSPLWEPVNSSFNFEGFGMGHGVIDLALIPWRLTFDTSRFVESPDLSLGVLPLLIGVGLVVAFVRRDGAAMFIGTVFLIGTIVWFVSVDYARYLLPVLALGAPLAAAGVAGLLDVRRRALRLATRAAVIALSLVMLPGLVGMMWNVPGAVPWTVDLGISSRPAYLRDALRQYRTYEWITGNIPDALSARFLGVGLSQWPIAYAPEHIFIGHQTLDGTRVLLARTDDDVLRELQAGNFRYVIIDEFPRPNPAKTSWLIDSDTFIASHFRLLYANAYVYVYAIGTPRNGGTEVLSDPQLGTQRANVASSPWKAFGAPPSTSDGGCAGVRIASDGGLLQQFAAEGNVLYSVEMTVTPLSPATTYAKLQINWNAPDPLVNIEIDPVSAGTATYTMATTAPPGASSGTIYLSGYGSEPVCVTAASVKKVSAGQ